MPHSSGLLGLKSASKDKIFELFQLARHLKESGETSSPRGQSAVLLFLEPSTRTRVSFEMACFREGLHPVLIQGRMGSSLEKDESYEDTFLNLEAMNPAVIVVRANDDVDVSSFLKRLKIPVINAGWGVRGHPTQALLDAFTLWQKWSSLEGKKLLLLGDIRHSRVASSHFELAHALGYEIRAFAPKDFLPSDIPLKTFEQMSDGLGWCDAVMALRTQKERHRVPMDASSFNESWGLNARQARHLRKDALVMHPGPVHWGTELTTEIKEDSRSIILDQVESGIYIRQALLRMCQAGTW